MDDNTLRQKTERIKELLLSSGKVRLVGISTTANRNNPSVHISAIRESHDEIFANFVLRDVGIATRLIEDFKGVAHYFLVDVEIKHEFSTGILATCRQLIESDRILFYKPNDITVESLDMLLACVVGDFQGKSAVILGSGNIAAKICIRIAERGGMAHLWGRDPQKVQSIATGINLFKRGAGQVQPLPSLNEVPKGTQIILGCTPGIPIVSAEMIEYLDQGSVVIDVGNGSISSDAIELARQKDITLYCLNVWAGFQGALETWRHTKAASAKMRRRILEPEVSIVSPGLLGAHGEVIVDDIDNPKKIIGVCDGRGDLLKSDEANKFITRYLNHAH